MNLGRISDNIFKSVMNFLSVADPEKVISGQYPECFTSIGPALKSTENSGYMYSLFACSRETCERRECPCMGFQEKGQFLVGLCFPNAVRGEKIQLVDYYYGPKPISELIITNPNKFYLPVYDCNPLFLSSTSLVLSNMTFPGKRTKVYLVYMSLTHPLNLFWLKSIISMWVPKKECNITYIWGAVCYRYIKAGCHFNISDYFVRKIQRFWRKKKRDEKIKKINQEIRIIPDRGIDYFKAKERFEEYQINISSS